MSCATSFNVIALLSGGKDSLFSLLHCMQNGHHVIALANLYPVPESSSDRGNAAAQVEGDDINSFMYQTVGHATIPLYAEALKLPLYRRQIRGKGVNKNQSYALADHEASDETEDLVPLLQEIKRHHPQANALSTGAILSTYQRTRVESVAVRAGLTPLAYLWQYPALPPPVERADSLTGLLDDMEAAGCDARLIKIATAGVGESLLWSRISDPSTKNCLTAGMSRFFEPDSLSLRGAVLGEGGEYETLAINGPGRLWKKTIDIDHKGNVVVEDEGGAVRLVLGEARLVEHFPKPPEEESPLVRVPVLLDRRFYSLRDRLSCLDSSTESCSKFRSFRSWTRLSLDQHVAKSIASMTVNNLTDPDLSCDIAEQTTAILDQLVEQVKARSEPTDPVTSVVSTTVLLRNMSDFTAVNAVYAKRFNYRNPPARVTICCGDSLQRGVLLSISFILTKTDPARINGLHVQSTSYWAPANIGPYSQAINVPLSTRERCREEIVHVAGQIPLVPSTMQLLEGAFLDQAILSLQHLWRVGQCVQVDKWVDGVAYLADAELTETQRRAKVASEVWRAANAERVDEDESGDGDSEEEGHADAWDLKYNRRLRPILEPSRHGSRSHGHIIPNHNALNNVLSASEHKKTESLCPPFLAAQVSSLPRSAPIEWHSLGLAHLAKHPASKPRLTVLTQTDRQISISSCRFTLQDPTDEADKDYFLQNAAYRQHMLQQAVEIEFFSIHIFAEEESSSSSATSIREQLSLAMSRLEQHPDNEDEDASGRGIGEEEKRIATKYEYKTHTTTATTYICSQAGHDALAPQPPVPAGEKAPTTTTTTIIPCRSLWGEEGRRVEVAIIGYREYY